MTTKPFAHSGFFSIHNAVFDVIMPQLSPNGFKVLCVAIRQTFGWVANPGGDPQERKEWDRISYSQFQEKTGIGSRATISRALSECVDGGYLLRRQAGTERGKPVYTYSLNTEYELPTGTEIEPVATSSKTEPVTSSKTEPVEGTEIEPVTSSKTEPTKEKAKANKKERGKEKAAGSHSGVWCSIHNVEMERREKDGAVWYSHRLPDGAWCKGAPGDVRPEPETREERRTRYVTAGFMT
jgi:hypothetical protein